MRVELLLAKDDGTWTTEIVTVPDSAVGPMLQGSPKWTAKVTDWAQKTLLPADGYGNVVFIGVYNENPEADSDDPRL